LARKLFNLHDNSSYDKEFGDYYEIIEVFSLGQTAEKYLRIPDSEERPIVFDRGELDIVAFTQANFILGRIEGGRYYRMINFFRIPFSFRPDRVESQKALIICLVPPGVSLERGEPQDKPGRFMNPEFLGTLYEQYLRLHWELLTGYRPFYYACLDSTGAPKENQRLFTETLDEILLKMKG